MRDSDRLEDYLSAPSEVKLVPREQVQLLLRLAFTTKVRTNKLRNVIVCLSLSQYNNKPSPCSNNLHTFLKTAFKSVSLLLRITCIPKVRTDKHTNQQIDTKSENLFQAQQRTFSGQHLILPVQIKVGSPLFFLTIIFWEHLNI